ncbi:uncharacterized protein LOC129321991 [Prosopis cineraria]|uniref:uncharacterized protein LOC129321991 n=1 Tax=Prosopis cineraria TaxID=364024 RepID=UPI002410385B|nr:uncharacterized protein LOC129321991 [Prosopis cineraria]
MEFQLPKNSTLETNHKFLPSKQTCMNSSCFFCIMSDTDSSLRRAKMFCFFKQMPLEDDQEHVLALSGLWKIAMTQPNDPEFPSLGIFRCMATLIEKGVSDKDWLLRYQNAYIPYCAAHIIGSYAMNKATFAHKAVKSHVVRPLMDLLEGKISRFEQRVALRAVGHLAKHEETFEALAEHEAKIVEAAIDIASTCLNEVYDKFLSLKETRRLKYHRNLLTRGLGGMELESRKAEDWANQLQCWSLCVSDCFARKERSLRLICKEQFLKVLCGMWGGMGNPGSPAGIGLARTLCRTKVGTESIAESQEVVDSLCNVSRSSDDRQYLAIESLLQLLNDPLTRYKVIDTAAPVLVDLVELRSIEGKIKVGQAITQTLLQDYHKIRYCKMSLKEEKAERALKELWDLKVDRVKRESPTNEEEIREKEVLAGVLKKEGNSILWSGDIEKAMTKYSEASGFCPLKTWRERIVLHSNRAQCHLLLRDADAALSDTTRAVCLSSEACPHRKSLWRRSQAYNMKGVTRESLMDCLMLINSRFKSQQTKGFRIPYCAARMVNKHMNALWLFASAESERYGKSEEQSEEKQ